MDAQVSNNAPIGDCLQEPLQALNANRALAAAIGEVLGASAIFNGAAVETIGGYVVLARFVTKRVAEGGVAMGLSQRDARLALATAGSGGVAAQDLLERLEFVGLIAAVDGGYIVPSLNAALVAELNHFRNRVSGWARRGKDRAESNPPSHPVRQEPAEAATTPSATTVLATLFPDPQEEQAAAFTQAKPQRATKSAADAPYVLRADKGDESPALPYELPCSGKVAYVSERYLEEVQALHPRLDALHELKLAIQWCKDNPARQKTQRGAARFLNHWYSNASSAKSMQAQVIGANNQRNGFGASATAQAPAGSVAADAGDDLAELDLADLADPNAPAPVGADSASVHDGFEGIASERIEPSNLEFDLDDLMTRASAPGAEQGVDAQGARGQSVLACEVTEFDGRPIPPVDDEPDLTVVSAEVHSTPEVPAESAQVADVPAQRVVITKPGRTRVFQRNFVRGAQAA